jgi:cell division protein FtsQ
MSLDPTLPRRRSAPLRTARGVPRIPPRALLTLIATIVVLGAGWMWVRDSSLAEVRDVEVTGTTSSEEAQVRGALESAGMDMTTLHVREEALRAAVARFSSVADLRIRTNFPHVLKVEVIEHRPVAALELGDRRMAAAGSGLLLRGVIADADLPTIRLDASPAGDRVRNANTLAALAIAGAAPDDLLRRVDRLWTGPRGMMLALRDGPDLIFGTRDDARRKWLAAARVLADQRAAGATYLDVRVPGRVAAGGLGPVVEPTPAPSVIPKAQP